MNKHNAFKPVCHDLTEKKKKFSEFNFIQISTLGIVLFNA